MGWSATGVSAARSATPSFRILRRRSPHQPDNGLTYTFHLRPGIRYSTGAPVRPEDFRRAIERVFRLRP